MKTHQVSRTIGLVTSAAMLALAGCQPTTAPDMGSEKRPVWQASASGTGEREDGVIITSEVADSDSTASRSPVYIGSGH